VETTDLADAIAGRDIPAPKYLERTDGIPLLYPGRVHWLQGESESLKSWAAQLAGAQVLLADGNAPYIDFEDDDRGVVARLLALGVPAATIGNPDRFRYIRPDEPLHARNGTLLPGAVTLGQHMQHTWHLAVIDGVTEAMTVEGLNLMDNGDVARWMALLPKRIAATGAAVAVIDHVVKAKEAQGRYALGGGHKLAGVSGATYRFVTTRPMSRATNGKEVTGVAIITVEKDRPGYVRAKAENKVIAVLELTAYPDGSVIGRLVPPGETTTVMPEWSLCLAVLHHLDTYEGAAKNGLEKDITGNAEAIRAATAWMVNEGWVEVRKEGNAHRHYLTDAGHTALEDETRQ